MTADIATWEYESSTHQWELIDARLGSALRNMASDQLRALQRSLQELHRSGQTASEIAQTIQVQAKDVALWLWCRASCNDVAAVPMLLGAIAVAIAWLSYRNQYAPEDRILGAIKTIGEGRAYMLPIPRQGPCFCSSDAVYKNCHGHPPIAK